MHHESGDSERVQADGLNICKNLAALFFEDAAAIPDDGTKVATGSVERVRLHMLLCSMCVPQTLINKLSIGRISDDFRASSSRSRLVAG